MLNGAMVGAVAAWLGAGCSPQVPVTRILQAYKEEAQYQESKITYPPDEAVFPPEIVPSTFAWRDELSKSDTWIILFQFQDDAGPLAFVSSRTEWTPQAAEWEQIKKRSSEKTGKIAVLGFKCSAPLEILSRARGSLMTSKDEVAAPIFYREVNLPFREAVKDPTRIRWRFGTISSPQPPRVVLEHLPVCGNCHSFSKDGKTLGMDVDYANNKGSYVITKVAKEMVLASSEIITWDSYKPEDHRQTFGLLSQVSPDGKAVISTVKDKSVFVAKPELAFSQLFFPIQGILAVYQPDNGTFQSLPGADDPEYVQSNPSWSPDGKYVLFARAKAYRLKNQASDPKLLLSEEDCAEFLREGRTFLFDIYRLPYNAGHGGKAEPLPGASLNGKSNYFPRYSPDGKWIVFCQAKSFMLLQPDSELYIIPAEGGEPRRLRGNTSRMNSWHSWSPNSRWLVFSSKANSAYTQLFLTHIDASGESSPPVVLAHFTSPDRSANIPEFVNAPPEAITKINERFLDDVSYARAAYTFEASGDIDHAIAEYEKALKINPRNVHAHQRLGYLLYDGKKQFDQGLAHTMEALRLDPADACAHYDLGLILHNRGQFDAAIEHLSEAVRLMPNGFDVRYNPADMRCLLAGALLAKQRPKEAAEVLQKAVSLAPRNARAHYLLASALAVQAQTDEALQHYTTACSLDAGVDNAPELHLIFSSNYEREGQFRLALLSAEKAFELARKRDDLDLLQAVQSRLEECRAKAGNK